MDLIVCENCGASNFKKPEAIPTEPIIIDKKVVEVPKIDKMPRSAMFLVRPDQVPEGMTYGEAVRKAWETGKSPSVGAKVYAERQRTSIRPAHKMTRKQRKAFRKKLHNNAIFQKKPKNPLRDYGTRRVRTG